MSTIYRCKVTVKHPASSLRVPSEFVDWYEYPTLEECKEVHDENMHRYGLSGEQCEEVWTLCDAETLKPVHTLIARKFTELLVAEIGIDNLREVVERNRTIYADQDICASHEFCDANCPMSDAFTAEVGREIDLQSDDEVALWNAAWQYAKDIEFPKRVKQSVDGISVSKLFPSGALEVSAIVNGSLRRKTYFDYTAEEAIADFRSEHSI